MRRCHILENYDKLSVFTTEVLTKDNGNCNDFLKDIKGVNFQFLIFIEKLKEVPKDSKRILFRCQPSPFGVQNNLFEAMESMGKYSEVHSCGLF